MRIHPIQPIATIILIVVLIYIKRKKGGAKVPGKVDRHAADRAVVMALEKAMKGKEDPPEAVYMDMRQRALETAPASLGLTGTLAENEPYGLLMEMGIADSVVTLACFANGDAGVYYQSGGGMVGGIAHENVRKAAKDLIALSSKALPRMSRAAAHPLPSPGMVRFYALTPRGTFTTETDRGTLGGSPNELSALFSSGQEVVAQMRQVQAQRAS
jgi:hypothetical protein